MTKHWQPHWCSHRQQGHPRSRCCRHRPSSPRQDPMEVRIPHPRTNVGTRWTSCRPACTRLPHQRKKHPIHPNNQTTGQPASQPASSSSREGAAPKSGTSCAAGDWCERGRAPEDEIALLLLLRRRIYDRVLALWWCDDRRIYRAASPVGSVQR